LFEVAGFSHNPKTTPETEWHSEGELKKEARDDGSAMRKGTIIRVVLVGGMLLASAASMAQRSDFHIVHAERITLQPSVAPSSAALKARPWQTYLRFAAYGRQFNLELEGHDRLLVNLPGYQREKLLGYRLFRGQLAGVADSWVRLTRTPSGDYGAVWDGAQLYTIVPAGAVRQALDFVDIPDQAATVIYRTTDTDAAQGQAFCAVVEPGKASALSSPVNPSYKSLLADLQANYAASVDLGGQLEIALLGDNEFSTSYPLDPQAALLNRLNIVDEIFSRQVGITVLATQLETFADTTDPFTSTAPVTLLEQLASFRDTTPAIRSRGLAHLVTGNSLDGSTVGIAYRGSLCDPHYGVSLSEGRGTDMTTSALIMAHELGHNFGAPHDGEAGACSAATQNYLMSPFVGGSSTFSSCSLAEMQPEISAAACIAPATAFADVSVTNTASSAQGIVNRAFPFTVEVSAPGTRTVQDATVVLTVPRNLSIASNSVPSSLCSSDFSGVEQTVLTCRMGVIPAGGALQMNLQLVGQQTGAFSGNVTVNATNDRFGANNSQAITFAIVDGSDGQIRFNAPQYIGMTRTPIGFDLTVESSGVEALLNARADISFGGLTIQSATSDVGSCAPAGIGWSCQFGTLLPPRSVAIHVVASGLSAGTTQGNAFFSATNDSNYASNFGETTIVLSPTRNVAVSLSTAPPPMLVGTTFSTTATLESDGVQTTGNIDVHIATSANVTIQSVIPSTGSCMAETGGYLCQVGPIPAGQVRTVALNATGAAVGVGGISASLDFAADDGPYDNLAGFNVDVRRPVDVALSGPVDAFGYDLLPFSVSVPVESIGLNAAQNVVIGVALPPGLTMRSAALAGATCHVAGSTATCTATTLAAGYSGNLALVVEAQVPGVYTGTVSATASSEPYTANNVADLGFQINAFVDTTLRLQDPPSAVTVGETFTLQYLVEQNRNGADNLNFQVFLDDALEIVSVQTPFQNCQTFGITILQCEIGSLAPNASRTATLTLRATARKQIRVSASVWATQLTAPNNNLAIFEVFADRQGDAQLTASSATASGLRGSDFYLPGFRIAATQPIDQATVELEMSNPAVATLYAPGSTSVYCTYVSSSRYVCSVGTLNTGEVRDFGVNIRGESAGSTTLVARLVSPNDTNAANNTATVTVSVSDVVVVAPPPTPTPTAPAASGGGGGAVDPRWLAILVALAARRQWLHRRQRSPRIPIPEQKGAETSRLPRPDLIRK
jgi:hypothetical protein